ncbi:alpha/beta hydrolase, partial [bacterium]|nr:alpha/beta hydrolase [bacterium]
FPTPASPAPREVTFETSDGVTVFGDLYERDREKAPTILLFHQAGANARAEYATIVPRLLENGYNVLAIDQRSGGSRLGGENRTLARMKTKREYSYCEAMPDLDAALRYVIAEGFAGPRFVWGSSYSAALVLQLGVEHPADVDGVLAFSPAAGDPMKGCDPTEAIGKIQVPVLALRPASEMEYDSVREQFEAFRRRGHRTHVAPQGVHGSSMLNPDRAKGGTDEVWEAVLAFLATVSGA